MLCDNAKAYHPGLWADTCSELGIQRRYTRPYSPWTNGKAEALIKTLLREWAYRFRLPNKRPPKPRTPRLPQVVRIERRPCGLLVADSRVASRVLVAGALSSPGR